MNRLRGERFEKKTRRMNLVDDFDRHFVGEQHLRRERESVRRVTDLSPVRALLGGVVGKPDLPDAAAGEGMDGGDGPVTGPREEVKRLAGRDADDVRLRFR